MEIEYGNNKLARQLSNATEIRIAFGDQAKKVASRIDEIISAPNLAVLMQIPAANCHPLKGDREGEWAVRISANHRLIFEIADEPIPIKNNNEIDTIKVTSIRIKSTTDYH